MSSLDVESVIHTAFGYDLLWFFFSFSFLSFLISFVVYFLWKFCAWKSLRDESKAFHVLLLFAFLLTILWNMHLFPQSALSGGGEKSEAFKWIVFLASGLWVAMACGGLASSDAWNRKAIFGLVAVIALLGLWGSGSSTPAVSRDRPDIIVIGFDSLRPEMPNEGYMPNLKRYLDQSVRFENAVTPLPRTYPSWISLLTGVYPVKHGARFNLMPYSYLDQQFKTLPQRLRENGYQTLYAMDEKRFANIDRRYGFDFLLGPKIGVGDFLFGFLSDLPILNIVRQVPLSRIFFPFIYSNRALNVSYLGSDFVHEVERGVASLKGDMPAFMVVHFCEPHWPYAYVSGPEKREGWLSRYTKEGSFQGYLKALPRADDQFAAVISDLRQAGRLDNALVFFVSDHGEAFARDKVTFRSSVGGKPFELYSVGHGTDVVQREQFQVLLAYQMYRDGKLVSVPFREDSQRVSLLDIYPTVLEHVGLGLPKNLDGYSLLQRKEQPERNFFVETDFNVAAMFKSKVDVGDVFAEGASAYRVEPNGYVSLRPEKIEQILLLKEYSVFSGEQAVAFGNYEDGAPGFRFFDYSRMEWRPIAGEDADASIRELQRALCKQFVRDPRLGGQTACKGHNVAAGK